MREGEEADAGVATTGHKTDVLDDEDCVEGGRSGEQCWATGSGAGSCPMKEEEAEAAGAAAKNEASELHDDGAY